MARIAKGCRLTVLGLGLGAAWLSLKLMSPPTHPTLTFYLDAAQGLRSGDAVYLDDQQVGQVITLQDRGRRIAITVRLDCRQGCRLNEGDQLYLWHDTRYPERQSLRVLPASDTAHGRCGRSAPQP